ncbi:hypothetical protein KDE13_09340 [Campylobacter sp. faydin G-140]|uniref:hypothetical protein n=1 Tax=Campylobacter anatolicus TaxID=2829105 RepID=UPI001B90A7A4|nr:hypothetical protein [Campylobacter anatolicus]MBR8466537.1 hypothetical protein [Campylobacter anatolicus]
MLQSYEKNIIKAFRAGLFDNSKHELYKNLADTYNYGIGGSEISIFYDSTLAAFLMNMQTK